MFSLLARILWLVIFRVMNWHRREGFEAANADKIFESTYTSQLLK